jgi:hypothetical protein
VERDPGDSPGGRDGSSGTPKNRGDVAQRTGSAIDRANAETGRVEALEQAARPRQVQRADRDESAGRRKPRQQPLGPGHRKLGDRVGIPAHSRSASYIQLANLLGHLLLDIEMGIYNTAITATNLYMVPANAQRLSEIITLYMNATGRDLKASTVSVAMRA